MEITILCNLILGVTSHDISFPILCFLEESHQLLLMFKCGGITQAYDYQWLGAISEAAYHKNYTRKWLFQCLNSPCNFPKLSRKGFIKKRERESGLGIFFLVFHFFLGAFKKTTNKQKKNNNKKNNTVFPATD